MNLSELARKLRVNKSTISRHARRLGVGTYGPTGMILTADEARQIAGNLATSKPGNPKLAAQNQARRKKARKK